jgi:hypothetical protein
MLDSVISSFFGLIVDETVTLGVTVLINSNLTGQDVTESREGIMEGLVIDRGVEVLDENVTRTGLTKRRIALRPHDTTRLTLDQGVVEAFQSTFTCQKENFF